MSSNVSRVGYPHPPIHLPGVTRRTLLKVGLASVASAMLPSIAQAAPKPPYSLPHKSLDIPSEIILERPDPIPIIVFWLDGGPSQFETWDPKPKASKDIRGYFSSIQSRKGTYICELFPKIKNVVDHTLILRNVFTTGIPDHPHQTLTSFSGSSEFEPNGGPFAPKHPSIPGRLTNEVLDPKLGELGLTVFNASYQFKSKPHPVSIPSGTLSLQYPGKYDGYPSPVGESIVRSELEARAKLRDQIQSGINFGGPQIEKYEKLFTRGITKLQDGLPKIFDLSTLSPEERERFGRNPLGNAALTATRLVRSGLKFIVIHYGFWDTHYSLEKDTKELTPDLDLALSSTIEELKDEALVVAAGEFGRTPKHNNGDGYNPPGRDHWIHSSSVLLAGKRITPGVIGQTDSGGFIVGKDGEFHSAHLFPTIFKLAGYEVRWINSDKLNEVTPYPVWPIV